MGATLFSTNRAFRGLTAPMETTEDGKFTPSYKTRYMTEDLPHGICVLRGFAEIVGVATPWMDRVINFCQDKTGLEYLKDGKIQGKDIVKSGVPQRWGLHTLEDLRRIYVH